MIIDFIHSISCYTVRKRKKMTALFSFATLAKAITTQIYLKGIVTNNILTNCSQINLTSFNISPSPKNTSYSKRG